MKTSGRSSAMLAQALGVVLCLCLACSVASAQTTNGAFHGNITDASGALVPDAAVRITSLSSGAVREMETDSSGYFAITSLPPGSYSISVSKAGFETAQVAHVELSVNEDRLLNLTLQVGTVTQNVNVTGAAAAVETAASTLSQVVGTREVVDLPLNGRQFTQLVLLSPGVAPREGGQQAAFTVAIGGGGISPSIDGQGGRKNFFSLDGNINDAVFTNTWAISPPPDAIQEFNVQSHIVDPQFGVSSGGNINVVTKMGSDQFHGDAYEYLRNNALDSRGFFDASLLPYRQNQYGVTAGGPVYLPTPWGVYDGRKEKTYVFGYWEGYRFSQSQTSSLYTVPTPAELSGDFSAQLTTTQIGTDCAGNAIFQGAIYNPYQTLTCPGGGGYYRPAFANNQIPSTMLNPAALTYLNSFFPAPNLTTAGYSSNYRAVLSNTASQDEFGIKMDHVFRNNDTLYGGFYWQNPEQLNPTIYKIGAQTTTNAAHAISAGYTHVFSPTLVGTLHYGYTFTDFGIIDSAAGTGLISAINSGGIEPVKDGLAYVPQASITGIGSTGQFAIPLGPLRDHVVSADVQKLAGKNTLTVGAMFYFYHVFDDGFGFTSDFDQHPSASSAAFAGPTGAGLASMLLDLPSGLFGFLGRTSADNRGHWYGGYMGDKWQASKKLNVQVGLRYDFLSPPSFPDDQISGIGPAGVFLISQALPGVVNFPNVRKSYFDPRFNGFQPRAGFAYQLQPNTVLRGGFGIFDDDETQRVQYYGDVTSQEWPFAVGISQSGLNQGPPGLFFDNLPALSNYLYPNSSLPAIAYGEDPQMRIPYTMEWNLGVQRLIGNNLTAEVDYVGSGSRRAITTFNWNVAQVPGSSPLINRVPFPQWGEGISMVANWGTGNYDGLLTKLQKKFSNGVSFLGSYTWSHCMDLQSEADNANAVHFYDRKSDDGPCDFDYRHNFVFSSVAELPVGNGRRYLSNLKRAEDYVLGGWNASGILRATSGAPFTMVIGEDIANTADNPQRPLQVGNPNPPGFQRSLNEWFDPSAFVDPAAFTYGNVGRNTMRSPRVVNVDFSLFKVFRWSESKNVQLRADAFNLLNHPQFPVPPGAGVASNGAFGGQETDCLDCGTPPAEITSASLGRIIQVALKFVW